MRFCCLAARAVCRSEICVDRDCEEAVMPCESRLRMLFKLVRAEANWVANPVSGVCKNACTLADLPESVELSFVASTERVPSLFRLTPRLARLVMPLLPVIDEVRAARRRDCASRAEPSASSGPPPEPSKLTANWELMSLMTVL